MAVLRTITPAVASGNVADFCVQFGERVSGVWCDETAYPASRPLAPGRPASSGQCGVATALLMEQLVEQYPDDDFYIACGDLAVAIGSQVLKVITGHAWVQHYDDPESVVLAVADSTANQAEGVMLPQTIVSSGAQLDEVGIVYQTGLLFGSAAGYTNYLSRYQNHFVPRLNLLRGLYNAVYPLGR